MKTKISLDPLDPNALDPNALDETKVDLYRKDLEQKVKQNRKLLLKEIRLRCNINPTQENLRKLSWTHSSLLRRDDYLTKVKSIGS